MFAKGHAGLVGVFIEGLQELGLVELHMLHDGPSLWLSFLFGAVGCNWAGRLSRESACVKKSRGRIFRP